MALQYPKFYKPDPSKPTVYDANGNYINIEQYKQMTGQQNVPNEKLNWEFVFDGPIPSQTNTESIWNNPKISALKSSLSSADQAFVESVYKVVGEQYSSGQPATVDRSTYDRALRIASEDPAITATYGDAAKIASKDLVNSLSQITGDQGILERNMAESQRLEKEALSERYAEAGTAQSGFRQKAAERLKQEQGDVITSTRRQLQDKLRTIGRGYESTYGTEALKTQPLLTATGQLTGTSTYEPIGGITGTSTYGKQKSSETTAKELGLLPTVSQTGVTK